jgi:hypothetical protein
LLVQYNSFLSVLTDPLGNYTENELEAANNFRESISLKVCHYLLLFFCDFPVEKSLLLHRDIEILLKFGVFKW